MSISFEIAPRHSFPAADLNAMHILRAKIFKGRMGWDVPVFDGLEIDGYDAINPLYMMMRGQNGIVRGCWRLLPTEGPYMLRDSFPELLHGRAAPNDPKIWELSRFAIETEGTSIFGFSSVALKSIGEIIAYGYRNDIEEYVTVTTTAIERMLKRAGVVITRFGPPIVIGVETAVALSVDVRASHHRLQQREDKALHA
jgi:acyl homoserine lactone synthase